MLRGSPAGAMRLDVGFGAFPECHRLGLLKLESRALVVSVLDGVDAIHPQLAGFPGFLSRL